MINEQNSTLKGEGRKAVFFAVDKAISDFKRKQLEASSIVDNLISAQNGGINKDLREKYHAIDPRFLRPSQMNRVQRLFGESSSGADFIPEEDEESLKQQISIVESEKHTLDERYEAAYKCLGFKEEVRVPHETLECYKVIVLSGKEPFKELYIEDIMELISGSKRNKCVIF